MDSIEAYMAFARMMETPNFSAVGRQMGVSQSTISKHIAALEAEFGVQLFIRTTRTISPTVEASHIYEQVQRMLEQVETVRAVAKGQRPQASGLLRIALPTSLGRCTIVPLLSKFLESHPLISVEALLTDAIYDPLKEGVELGITVHEPRSSSLISRSLKVYQRVVVASPSYLAKHGTPETPLDLDGQEVIVSTEFAPTFVEFDSDYGRQTVTLNGRLRTNSDETAYDMAKAGLGIAIVPAWIVEADVSAKVINVVLGDFFLTTIPVSLVYPQTRFLSRRARSFIDFIVPELARH